jgi:hypothetical protein
MFEKAGYCTDHIDAQANGGGHETGNLFPCCKPCNSQKGNKTIDEYRTYLAEKMGLPKWVFYFEVQNFSLFGQLLSSMYSVKIEKP